MTMISELDQAKAEGAGWSGRRARATCSSSSVRRQVGSAAGDKRPGMKARLASLWERLRSSFWFVPALMVVGAIVLSFATLLLDQAIQSATIADFRWIRQKKQSLTSL
jgi:hypothetical protein